MADIFLSYSRKDAKAADRIQQYLESRGLVFFRDTGMTAGENWVKKTGEMLRSTRVVLVLWSKNSVTSDNVSHEAMIAKELGKLVPAMIDDVSAMDLPMGLSVMQAADVADWRSSESKGLERLAAAIEQQLKTPLKPAPKQKRSPLPLVFAMVVIAVAAGAGGYVYLTSQPSSSPGQSAEALPLSAPILTTEARDIADAEAPASGDDLVAGAVAPMAPAAGERYDLKSLPQSVQDVVTSARRIATGSEEAASMADQAALEAQKQQAAARKKEDGTMTRRSGPNLIEGRVVEGKFNGHVVVTVESGDFKGDVYLGQVENEVNQGYGVYRYSPDNPDWISVEYRGHWDKGTLNGQGVIEFKGDQWYSGEFEGGRMSGTGTYRDATVTYEGQYRNGKKHGLGVRWHARDNSIEAGRSGGARASFWGR